MDEVILKTNQKKFYEKNGYAVFHDLIPGNLIDNLLERYRQDIVSSKVPFFRQNTYRYETNALNQFGHVKQSFLDVHGYDRYPKFSQSSRDIFCSQEMLGALGQLSEHDHFNLMQGMLFDANTETQPHQECWYLDTIPHGHLIIAWIALEDIDERAGRFYVIPQADDNLDFLGDSPDLSHTDWLKLIKQYVEANQDKIVAPALKRGDVLFLNSLVIHGSLPTQDERFSRKSLTAHYIPSTYKFGNLFKIKDVTYKTYRGIDYYAAHQDYSWSNQLMFDLKNKIYNSPLLLKVVRKALGKSK